MSILLFNHPALLVQVAEKTQTFIDTTQRQQVSHPFPRVVFAHSEEGIKKQTETRAVFEWVSKKKIKNKK